MHGAVAVRTACAVLYHKRMVADRGQLLSRSVGSWSAVGRTSQSGTSGHVTVVDHVTTR